MSHLIPTATEWINLLTWIGWTCIAAACCVMVAGAAGWCWMALGWDVQDDAKPDHWDRFALDTDDPADPELPPILASLRPLPEPPLRLVSKRHQMDLTASRAQADRLGLEGLTRFTTTGRRVH